MAASVQLVEGLYTITSSTNPSPGHVLSYNSSSTIVDSSIQLQEAHDDRNNQKWKLTWTSTPHQAKLLSKAETHPGYIGLPELAGGSVTLNNRLAGASESDGLAFHLIASKGGFIIALASDITKVITIKDKGFRDKEDIVLFGYANDWHGAQEWIFKKVEVDVNVNANNPSNS